MLPACGRAARKACCRPTVRLGLGCVWTRPSPCTAATGPSGSPTCSARTTSPSRCGRRWPANRVHHAYLFSGPRGCGKTTSARILARALNCEQAPVAEPCGECQSCRDLARDGAGQPRRDRDRRGQPRRRRRRPRPARARVVRPDVEPLQDLHRRRGAHGDPAGLQRPAQGRRGAAAARQVRLRHHRARPGAADDPLPHPPLPVPAAAAAAAHRLPRRDLRPRAASRSSRRRCRWSYAPAAARPATPSACSTS